MAQKNNASDVKLHEFPSSVWHRPSMYLGGRGSQKSVGVREIVDNSIHEAIRGHADKMRVTFSKDGGVLVQDNGSGLPTDEKYGKNGIILTMATLHAGTNFNSHVERGKAGAGVNGVGASVVNAMSKRFDAIVYRDGKCYRLSFKDGFPGHFSGEDPDAKFTPSEDIKVTKDTRTAAEKKGYETGTIIKLWYNDSRFPSDEAIDVDDLSARLRYNAYVVPKFNIEVLDETHTEEDGSYRHNHYYSEHGIRELVEAISPGEPLPQTTTRGDEFTSKGIYTLNTEANYQEIVPDDNGVAEEVTRDVAVEFSFRYNNSYGSDVLYFVNTIQTHLDGVHVQALHKALLNAFGAKMSSMRGMVDKDNPLAAEDIVEGMTGVMSINVPEPQFEGQQKDRLSGPELKKALTASLTSSLKSFVDDSKNQKILKPVFKKISEAAKNRKSAADARQAKRKVNKMSSSSMPEKLADCDITGTEESELLICEGNSAAGTVMKARDATYQAVIPIRGKILNSFAEQKMTKILSNEEIIDISKAMGAGIGKDFDPDKARYGRVLFAADADSDGGHICILLYSVFYRLFRPMIEEGRVYQTVPPLFEVTIGSGASQRFEYVTNDQELNALLKKLNKSNEKYKVERNKGLGQMDAKSFYDTVLDPQKRILHRITIDDVQRAEEALELTLGKKSNSANLRKDFMNDNFSVAIESGLVTGFEGLGEIGVDEEHHV